MGKVETMFWRKKAAEPRYTEGEWRALQAGRDVGDAMTRDLEKIMTVRFKPIGERYMGVLRSQLKDVFDKAEVPPAWGARTQMGIFSENVVTLREKMIAEIHEHMHEWAKVADDTATRQMFDALIESEAVKFTNDLTTEGLNFVMSLGEEIVAADGRWRVIHPEKAAQFPKAN